MNITRNTMETKFNFNSQVCTSREQSERLLKLGLKKETADCAIFLNGDNEFIQCSDYWGWKEQANMFPAWSLHRLFSLIPKEFEVDVIPMYGKNYRMPIELHILSDLSIVYTDLSKEVYKGFYYTSIYDSLISCIEWQVEQGYFNKEYLNENI